MDVIETIMTRRSIRQFSDKEVEESTITKLIQAGMQAPSARNTQAWHFIVIKERRIINQIADFHPYSDMLRQTPQAISVCGDLEIEPSEGYNALNCAAATQNILLAAHGTGLGAVWLGIYPRQQRIKDLRAVLNIPDQILPVSLIAFGFPEEIPRAVIRFKEERVHFNTW